MRCFIAIEPPQDIQQQIAEAQAQVKATLESAGWRASWIKTGNHHLTLKFLGNITDGQTEHLCTALDEDTLTVSFEIMLGGVIWLPSARRPRVCALSIASGADFLQTLAAAVDTRLEAVGYPRESRPFHAHVTLARIKSVGQLSAQEQLPQTQISAFACRHIVLFRSLLSAQGSQYTALRHFALS